MRKEQYLNRNLRVYIVIDVATVPSPYTNNTGLKSEQVSLYPLCPLDTHMIALFTCHYPHPGFFFGDKVIHNIREHTWLLEGLTFDDKGNRCFDYYILSDPVVLESRKLRPPRGKEI